MKVAGMLEECKSVEEEEEEVLAPIGILIA
jgi:hypothetical protein